MEIAGEVVGKIPHGLLILLGITADDTEETARSLAKKCVNLRIFEDADGKMNLSLPETGGEVLVVSQFTLYGDTRGSGRRPSFTAAARPETAIPLYERFIAALHEAGVAVSTGRFGADMQVYLCNDGPVTLMVEL